MARRSAAAPNAAKGAPARAKKKAARPAAAPEPAGNPVLRILACVAILTGLGYAALRIPIGRQTLAEAATELVRREPAAKAAAAPTRPVPAPEVRRASPAPVRVVATEARPEQLDATDRAALDRLLAR